MNIGAGDSSDFLIGDQDRRLANAGCGRTCPLVPNHPLTGNSLHFLPASNYGRRCTTISGDSLSSAGTRILGDSHAPASSSPLDSALITARILRP